MTTLDKNKLDTLLTSNLESFEKGQKGIPIADVGAPNENKENAMLYMFDGKSDIHSPLKAYRVGKIYPDGMQDDFARILVEHLNKSHSFDGYWKLVWCNPVKSKWCNVSRLFRTQYPTTLLCVFFDKDDDKQLSVTIEDDIMEMLEVGFRYWEEQCVQAYEVCQSMKRSVGIIEGVNTYKAAKGEQPKGELTIH